MAKYLTKATPRSKGLDLQFEKLQSVLEGKAWQRKREAAGYTVPDVLKY